MITSYSFCLICMYTKSPSTSLHSLSTILHVMMFLHNEHLKGLFPLSFKLNLAIIQYLTTMDYNLINQYEYSST